MPTIPEDYLQPALPSYTGQGFYFNSIDFQIVTKSDGWNQDQTKRLNEYQEALDKNATYVAIAVPYDNATKYANYVADARTKGLKIYFRSHWNAWEGDNGVGNIATPTSLTRSGTTATCVTSTAHGLETGDTVSMNGMNETDYRGVFTVTVIDSTTFTYTVANNPTTPATGNIGWRYACATYLRKTYEFIVNNSTLFEAGDIFAFCVEAQQADGQSMTFKTPGTTTFDYTIYNQFLKDQVKWANEAFKVIGLEHQVYTSFISLGLSNINLAGQTLDSGDTGNSNGLTDSDIVTYFGGILTIDHYLSDTYGQNSGYGTKYASDLDKIHTAFPSCQIMIGEWGFKTVIEDYGTSTGSNSSTTLNNTGENWIENQYAGYKITITGGLGSGQTRTITSNTSTALTVPTWTTTPDNTSSYDIYAGDVEQEAVYSDVVDVLLTKAYVIGINFWNHLGQLQSSLWEDASGTIVAGGRSATTEVNRAFTTFLPWFGNKFIQKNGNEFSLNGKRFRFNGINKYQLIINKTSQTDVATFFQYCRNDNIKVVRTWAFLDLFTRVRYTTGSNLITNPDVESNSNDWTLGAQASWTTDDAQSGTHSLKNASTSGYSAISTPVTVTANTDYVLSFYTKVSNPSGNPPVIFIGTSPGYAQIKDGGYNYSTDGIWQEKQVTFNSGNNTTIYITFQNWNGNATAYYDNINVSVKTTSELATQEDYLIQLDKIVYEASNYGIKLKLVLADNPTYNSKLTWINRANTIYGSGISTTYPYVGFWNHTDCRTLYKAAMDFLLNRVNSINGIVNKNNSAIGFIELINEGRYDVFDSEGGHQNAATSATNPAGNIYKITSWINDVGGHFQIEDVNHLLGFGGLSHTWEWKEGDAVFNGSGYGISYHIQSALDVLDYGDFHFYPTQDAQNSMNYPSGETDIVSYGQQLLGLAAPITTSGTGVASKVCNLKAATQVGDILKIHVRLNKADFSSMSGLSTHGTTTDNVGNTYNLDSSVLSGDGNRYLTYTITGTQTIEGATALTTTWTGGNFNVTYWVDEISGRVNDNNSRTSAGLLAQLEDFVSVMKANGKPVVCGEFGFSRDVIRNNYHFPLYPRVNAIKLIGNTLWDAGLDGLIHWHGESSDSTSYTINMANTWNGVTTNDNFDDRPIISLFKVWAARFMAVPFPKFHRYGKQI